MQQNQIMIYLITPKPTNGYKKKTFQSKKVSSFLKLNFLDKHVVHHDRGFKQRKRSAPNKAKKALIFQ